MRNYSSRHVSNRPLCDLFQRFLTPGNLYEIEKLVCVKWTRLLVRKWAAASWHWHGLLLWLVRQPRLRYLVMPWPGVTTVEEWKDQAITLAGSKPCPKKHLFASAASQWTLGNLQKCKELVSKLGSIAFLEDDLAMRMIGSKKASGKMFRKRADKETALAIIEESRGRNQAAITELIGPKGGLPTKRDDLIRLAALLHHDVAGLTVEQMRRELRVTVEAMRVPKAPPPVPPGHREATAATGFAKAQPPLPPAGTIVDNPSGRGLTLDQVFRHNMTTEHRAQPDFGEMSVEEIMGEDWTMPEQERMTQT